MGPGGAAARRRCARLRRSASASGGPGDPRHRRAQLPPAPPGAGRCRAGPRRRGGLGVARVHGAAPRAIRSRPADLDQPARLHEECALPRSRLLVPPQYARAGPHPPAPGADDPAHGRDARPLRRRGHGPRPPRRGAGGRLARHLHLDPRPDLLRHPALLDRPHADRRLLDQARLAPDERDGDGGRLPRGLGPRRRHHPPPRTACRHAVALLHGALRAPHAGGRARAGGNGLRGDGARQGAERSADHAHPRPA